MADDAEALRDDLRTVVRALDFEVQRLVTLIGRAEGLLQTPAPRRAPHTAAVPITTPARTAAPTRFREATPAEGEDDA
jgi:hypothetical protein